MSHELTGANTEGAKGLMSSVALDDIRQLVNLALVGDQRAMLEIVERYKQRVFSLCYRMLGQREEAEDMSQEAFIRVLNNLPSWDQNRAFEPWLMTIAANRCRTQLSRRKPVSSLDQTLTPEDSTWSQQHEAEQLWEEVKMALSELPPKHRAAFELFHQQQLNYADLAERLGVPVGTAKTWVHRARHELARRLADREVVEL